MNGEPPWRKSSYSTEQADNCLELRPLPRTVHVRDSKLGPSPQLTFLISTWDEFISSIPDA
ncbi:DUF397 domain-containing protein [Streptomyces sp. AV19]|uniref:DUF397 domain-containing protein n=1 Tax=Streptomyces sp. AV19 TaxID=2793068 RepID=UPI0018FEC63E|nr:DUF397 domain-containing protein [Streptomyces sp. AV19]MBH1934900.1 DUF397 domain-containing protein [Streptomyces sp. AV19]MDG4537034.1 DUF397 domain-containing protein [Streptomyces sp. AV19]